VATRRIGELLVAEGLLSEAAVQRALGYQRLSGEKIKLGSILLNWDLLAEDSLLGALAKLHRCPAVRWETLFATPLEIVRLVPGSQASRLAAIPYGAEKGLIRVAFANPSDLAAQDEIAALTGRRVMPGVTTEARLLQAHQKFYGRHVPPEYRPILQKLQRRNTTSLRVDRDFTASDVVETEKPTGASPARPSERGVSIPVQMGSADSGPREISGDRPLELPEFPRVQSGAPTRVPSPSPYDTPSDSEGFETGKTSLHAGEDSLSDWVGRALSSFSGESEADPPPPVSSSGASDPSMFGREDPLPPEDPGALAFPMDSLPAASAVQPRANDVAARPGPDSALSETHTRSVPSSIPPFRRATDPTQFRSSTSPVDRHDEIAASMWRPGPAEQTRTEPPDLAAALADVTTGAGTRRRDDIADSVISGSLGALPRVLLLGSGKAGVTGWRGRGPGLTPEAVAAIRVAPPELSVLSSVEQSGIPHFGSIDPAEWPRAFADLFGAAPPECAIFPIRILDGIAAFLYADRLGAPMQYEDFAIVARAAASAANVFSRFLLRSDRSRSAVRS
jgi:hypothetical protein